MRRNTRTAIGRLALALAAVSAACGGDAAAGRQSLRVAVAQWPGYDVLYLAEAEDLYAQRGVDVEIVDMYSISDAQRAFSRGEVDGLAMTLAGAPVLDRSGRRYATVMLLDYSDGGDAIIAARDVEGVADLEGRTVGVELAPLGIHLWTRALETHGLDVDSVEMRYAAPGELPSLLRSGLVDAIQTSAPRTSNLAAAGYPVIFSSSEMPGEIVDVVAFGSDVLRERREEVEGFVAAWTDALDLLESDEASALSIMGRRGGVTAPEMRRALGGVRLLRLSEQLEAVRDGGAVSVCRKVGRLLADAGMSSSASRTSTCGLDPSVLEVVAG